MGNHGKENYEKLNQHGKAWYHIRDHPFIKMIFEKYPNPNPNPISFCPFNSPSAAAAGLCGNNAGSREIPQNQAAGGGANFFSVHHRKHLWWLEASQFDGWKHLFPDIDFWQLEAPLTVGSFIFWMFFLKVQSCIQTNRRNTLLTKSPLMINIKTLCNGECSTRVFAVQIRLNIFQKNKEVKKKEGKTT